MKHLPYWMAGVRKPEFPQLHENISTEILVIGGGITGMTTAYLLSEEGCKVTLIDSGLVSSGVTGHTSGHLTVAIDAKYHKISENFSLKTAQAVYKSTQQAIDRVEYISRQEQIDCDFKRVDGWLYTENADDLSFIEKEFKAVEKAGVAANMAHTAPFEFAQKKGMVFRGQASFHPVEYLYKLAEVLHEKKVAIYEHTRAGEIKEKNDHVKVNFNDRGIITANKVIVATHSPINFNPIQLSIFPYRSYCMGVKVSKKIKEGLYWDTARPYFYIRTTVYNDEQMLIIGGCDHKSGQSHDENASYRALQDYIEERFQVVAYMFRWSGQIFVPADGLPYIGKAPFKDNVYIASGFSGDGLLFGTVAADLLKDLVRGKKNAFASVYAPGRLNLKGSTKEVIAENFNNMVCFFKGRLGHHIESVDDIKPNEGDILEQEGELYAVYKDIHGRTYSFSPVCTHLKCIVHWNKAEKTWDCPCHGGRYNALGEVIEGPPDKSLGKKEIPLHEGIKQ